MNNKEKTKKPWYKKVWVWVLVALFLIIGIANVGKDASNTKVMNTEPSFIVETTNKVDVVTQAIADFGLDASCVNIIRTYVPKSDNIVKITQNAAANYNIHMKDGTIYLMPVFIGGDNIGCVARISTNESDADKRTFLYDFYGKTNAPTETPPSVTTENLTMSQKNAIRKAESYLDYMAFSRPGLIKQLEYEGFPSADAAFAVDYITVDWNQQAALKAKSYLDFMAFSSEGLAEQLKYEGFTDEQIAYALKAVGY